MNKSTLFVVIAGLIRDRYCIIGIGISAMKGFLAAGLVTLLGFTTYTAIADTLDGKGIWCPNDTIIEESFGFWFKNDKAHNWYISIFNVRSWTYDYFEKTRQININLGEYILNRSTLEMSYKDSLGETLWQCFVINSEQALAKRLKAIADQVKEDNKI